jgi:hypothetical protein
VAILVAAVVGVVLRGASVFAAPYPGGDQTPPEVKGQKFFPGTTAHTGTDILPILLIALLLVVIGVALRVANRRRAASGDS